MGRLQDALVARIRRHTQSQDRLAVLDPEASDEASRLWEAALAADGDPRSVPADVLYVLGHFHMARFGASPEGHQEDLRAALTFFGLLEEVAPERVPSRIRDIRGHLGQIDDAESLMKKGADAFREYQRSGQLPALDAAVEATRRAVAVIPPDHPGRVAYLSNLMICLYQKFGKTGDLAELDEAISAGQEAVRLSSPGHPDLAQRLWVLGQARFARFQRSRNRIDLDGAIDLGQQAIATLQTGHPNRSAMLSILRDYNLARERADQEAAMPAGRLPDETSQSTDQDRDGYPPGSGKLETATAAVQQAIATSPADDPDLPGLLLLQIAALHRKFSLTGDPGDLDATIEACREATAALSADHHDERFSALALLGASLMLRFERAANTADLDAAIEASQQAVVAIPSGYPDKGGPLAFLETCFVTRFERTENAADLDAAIDVGQRAVSATPSRDPRWAERHSVLASSLQSRFRLVGEPADLNAAVDAGQRALTSDDSRRDEYASALAQRLRIRFEHTGSAADLDAAIEICEQAAATIPRDDAYRSRLLEVLGSCLFCRFEQAGADSDLDAAIDADRQALAAKPGDPGSLSELGIALRTRYDVSGDPADLDAAIEAGQQAVNAAPSSSLSHLGFLSNLAVSLTMRFERTGDIADIGAAIDAGRRAVTATPPGDPDLAMYHSNLGGFLYKRYTCTGNTDDIDAAVSEGQTAVSSCPPGHPRRSMYHSSLGLFLTERYTRTGAISDIDAAIHAGRRAVDAASSDHPARAAYLSNLARGLLIRFRQAKKDQDLDAAIDCWRQASQVAAAPPRVRLSAAQWWGSAAASAGQMHEAAEAYSAAVALLPVVAWHGLDRATRENQLAQWAGLAADAAACAVLDSQAKPAVELLEQGRSVLWTQALNLRTDLTRLAVKQPGLARRLDSVRAALDSPLPGPAVGFPDLQGISIPLSTTSQHDPAERRRRTAREWDEVLAQVRALGGFERFLTATPYHELATAARGGAVVIVNASHLGCHAILITPDSQDPGVVDLPGLSRDSAVEHANAMLALTGAANSDQPLGERQRGRRLILDVLAWLWEVIAEPVLTELGHASTPHKDAAWPRVWWCLTGPLTVLPIHAAGHHPRQANDATGGMADCVIDRVVSSYTPTLAALARARRPLAPSPVRHLGVGMATTPGLPPLPAVPEEMKVLARHFPPGELHRQLIESEATRARLLDAIPGHSWMHLACHAEQQHADPDRSGFALWDGSFTITDLAALPSGPRDLAFLSACQTAAGSTRHLDEAIHLAAAMQFLGYRQVIATMWTIADPPGPPVADAVYSTLTETGQPDPSRAAEALHHAIRALRRQDPANPLRWAPYIHFGP